jgi:hypothetical protein
MEIHVPIKREYVKRSLCFWLNSYFFVSTLHKQAVLYRLHREGKDVERRMEGTVIAEGRGKGGEKKERKLIYLHLTKQ